MRTHFYRRLSFLAAALSLPACWTSAQHGEVIDQRLAALEADDKDHQALLDKQQRELAAQLPKIDDKLKEMNETLEKLNQATHRSGADVAVRLDDMQEKMQQLQGQLDETRHRLEELTAGQQAATGEVDRKLAAALGDKAMAEVDAREKAMKLAPADRPGLFAVAFKEYKNGHLDVGRELFGEYLHRYPNDPQAGEAQFYAGDCLLLTGQPKQAALAFQKVSDQYPKSAVVCDSRLKLGMSFLGLKMNDEAKLAFEDTLKRCGGKLAVAKQAKAKLAELAHSGKRPHK